MSAPMLKTFRLDTVVNLATTIPQLETRLGALVALGPAWFKQWL